MIDAVREALAAGEPERAVLLLRRNWLRLILESRTSDLEALCVAVPAPHSAELLLIRACCRDLAGDPHGATFLRGQGMRRIPARPADDVDAADAADADASDTGGADAATDFVTCCANLLLAPDGPSKAALADRARQALSECDPEDDYPSALFLLGWTEIRLRRNFPEAIALLRAAADEARLQSRDATHRLAQSNLAFALGHAGAFTEAERLLDALPPASGVTDWDRFEGGLPESLRGSIAFWRGDPEAAVAHLDSVVHPDGPGTNFEAQSRLYLAMSVIALGRRDRYRACAELIQGVSATDKHGIPWDSLRRVVAAWLAVAEGHPDRARAIAESALARPGIPVAHALLAELYQRLGEPGLARRALALVTAGTAPLTARVSTLVTTAALHSAGGRGTDAHDTLDRALAAAAPEGILAPFLSPDPTVSDLLTAHAARGSRHETLLLEIFRRRDALTRAMTDPLTAREREILAYLRTTMTADEIAAHLHVAYPTVKTHIRSIYRKLDVTSRRDAVRADRHRS